jgi:hypothetical protein
MAVDRRRHLILEGTGRAEPFTSPAAGGSKFRTRRTQRDAHGEALRRQLARIQAELDRRREQASTVSVDPTRGFYLEFESPPGFELKLESLENRTAGIELAATRDAGSLRFAIVFVPQGKLDFFVRRVEQYLRASTPKGKPKNLELIESIAAIRLAVAESFWTDPRDQMPAREAVVWWEAWLRGSPEEVLERFRVVARRARMEVGEEQQAFPDRTVVLLRTSLTDLAKALDVMDMLAELRRVRQIGSFFMRLARREQARWTEDLLSRIAPAAQTTTAVTILDTGVYRAHPLLAQVLDVKDVHAARPTWGVHDHHGHGTEMAGIAAYGDLGGALLSGSPLTLGHRLESVKILPPSTVTSPHLYGAITADGIARAEIQAPERSRVYSMSICTAASDRGEPTAWSAAIDQLAAGVDDDERRLFVVSAGNLGPGAGKNYPIQNELESILDPGHAWNALTVGACTSLTELDEPAFAGWTCVAPPGGLAPTSTTSVGWQPQWPLKPDLVLEGGNMVISPQRTEADSPDSLSVLTTYYRDDRLFTSSGDTSAATAKAAHHAATIRAAYPTLWPETVRALLVDSAEWTPVMRSTLGAARNARSVEIALRCFGFGIPDLERAVWSAGNALTLIVQGELQPFEGARSKEMDLHELPWPRAELEQLGDVEVELRVSLSYFIEPNPARRGWKHRHRYASHGLRFAVQKPTESVAALRKRVNKDARDEDDGNVAVGDAEGWLLKPNLRGKGSLHHDRWTGTAAELARRDHVAVYPVIGWWRQRLSLERSESRARYALVVTIRTPPTSIDIYQAVVTKIAVPVAV